MNFKYILGIIFVFFHYLFNFGMLLTLYYSNNFYLILAITFISFMILWFWYFFNDCILTGIENYLLEKPNKYKDLNNYIQFKIFARKIKIYKHIYKGYHIYFLLIIFLFSIYKLYIIFKNNSKK